jgi:hypothetical protein
MNLLDKIEQGIEYLPEKDISIARQLLEERDFEELIFLVESSLYKINDNINSSHPKEEYLDIDLEKLEYLLDNLNDYYSEITGDGLEEGMQVLVPQYEGDEETEETYEE